MLDCLCNQQLVWVVHLLCVFLELRIYEDMMTMFWVNCFLGFHQFFPEWMKKSWIFYCMLASQKSGCCRDERRIRSELKILLWMPQRISFEIILHWRQYQVLEPSFFYIELVNLRKITMRNENLSLHTLVEWTIISRTKVAHGSWIKLTRYIVGA